MHTLATSPRYPAPYRGVNVVGIYKHIEYERRTQMLWTITIILFILWVVGLVSSYTLGGWIHILLVLAIIVLIFNLLSGRRAL
jgi:uncharacterized protein DUF5670